MTIGQRIAQLRKERGMSQEELGEAMGVSRQAISKWESDTALPEVEKLIALSRLFSIPVGQLLGVEEPAPEQEAQAGADAGEAPGDRAADLAEEVLRRYVAARPAPPPKRRWPWVVGAVLVLFAVGQVESSIRTLQSQLGNLQSQVSRVDANQSNVNSQIQSITQQVEQSLASQASRLVNSEMRMEKLDLQSGTAQISVQVTPKSVQEGESMALTVSNGEDSWSWPLEPAADGLTRRAELTLPLVDGLRYYVTFQADGEQQTEELTGVEEFSRLAENTSLVLDGESGGGWSYSEEEGGIVFSNYEVHMIHFAKMLWTGEDPPQVESCTLQIRRGDRVWKTLEMECTDRWEDGSQFVAMLTDLTVPCGEGETVELAVVARDNYGRTASLELGGISPDGSLSAPASPAVG